MSAFDTTDPKHNARKIGELLTAGTGFADLYRTIVAGPSGQRSRICVGRIRFRPYGPDHFSVVDLSSSKTVGFARAVGPAAEWWAITQLEFDGELRWRGYVSSLSVGVDVLVNGEHAALGRHGSQRISRGTLTRTLKSPAVPV